MVRVCLNGWLPRPSLMALSFVAVHFSCVLAQPLTYDPPLRGLDLVEDKTADIIESMRAAMSVSFLEAALLEATMTAKHDDDDHSFGRCSSPGEGNCEWPTYSMTDAKGVVHVCTVHDKTQRRGGTRDSHSKRKSKGVDVSKVLAPLEGTCATIPSGYWSYIWCHRGFITQFHADKDGTETEIRLGQHTRTEVKRAMNANNANDVEPAGGTRKDYLIKEEKEEGGGAAGVSSVSHKGGVGRGAGKGKTKPGSWISRLLRLTNGKDNDKMKDSAKSDGDGRGKPNSFASDPYAGITEISQVAAIHDFYEGGDICEVNGQKILRQTRTTITCCANKVVGADAVPVTPVAMFVSIQEVSECSYLVKVCSQLLCPDLAEDDLRDRDSRDGGVLDVLDSLETCFPIKRDSWWSYELCVQSGARQFHEELIVDVDGAATTIKTEFSLGKFDRSSIKGMGQELVHPGAEGEGGAIELEFTGGTECDLTGIQRSTTVHLKCGFTEDITEIVEDSTCHYRMVAASPLLCSHPVLMPKTVPTREVKCVAESK